MFWLSIFATLLAGVSFVQGAGVLVHTEILRRAAYILSLPLSGDRVIDEIPDPLPVAAWIEEHLDYAQAGVFFPDWGYECLLADQASEIAHWPPFLGVAMSHLLTHYPALNQSTSGQRLAAFIFGIAAHQNTDATWHSINFNGGFLQVMADLDFKQDLSAAHAILDPGADMILAKRFSSVTSSDGFDFLSDKWSLPIDAVIDIYKTLGFEISRYQIQSCAARGFAALRALRRFGASLSARYARKSPFMSTQLENYYLGSIGEASNTAVNCWLALEQWIRKGVVPENSKIWEYCEPMKSIHRTDKVRRCASHSKSPFVLTHKDPWLDCKQSFDLDLRFAEPKVTNSRAEDDEVTSMHFNNTRTTSPALAIATEPEQLSQPFYFLTPSIPYAEFGTSLSFVATESGLQLAIGSPRDTDARDQPARGATYVVPISRESEVKQLTVSRQTVLRTSHMPNMTIDSYVPHHLSHNLNSHSSTGVLTVSQKQAQDNQRFGQSTANLNLNGLLCLAVLSTSKIEIFRIQDNSVEIVPFMTIIESGRSPKFSDIPIATEIYTFRHDESDVLAILSPWVGQQRQGAVYLFSVSDLRSGFMSLQSASLTLRAASATQQRYLRFGSSIAYSSRYQTLFIGQAGTRQILAYKLSSNATYGFIDYDLKDPSTQVLDTGFGSSGLLCMDDILYIGSSTEDESGDLPQAGKVRRYHLEDERANSENAFIAQEVITQVRSPFAHFGSKITPANLEDGVLISAVDYLDRGAIFFLPKSVQSDQKSAKQRVFRVTAEESASSGPGLSNSIKIEPCLIGSEAGGSRFGEDVLINHDQWLAVGAPGAHGIGDNDVRAGKLYIFDSAVCTQNY